MHQSLADCTQSNAVSQPDPPGPTYSLQFRSSPMTTSPRTPNSGCAPPSNTTSTSLFPFTCQPTVSAKPLTRPYALNSITTDHGKLAHSLHRMHPTFLVPATTSAHSCWIQTVPPPTVTTSSLLTNYYSHPIYALSSMQT